MIIIIKDYFKNIDTEDKAYWLGFLYADGCISKDYKSLHLDIGIVDIGHIYKFAENIESNHKISIHGDNNQFVRIVVTCEQMCIDLINKGCIPNKSLILEFPNTSIVPKHLIYHFIRGYFDGDGCLSHSVGNRKRKDRDLNKLYHYDRWDLVFVGTKSMMDGIAYYMNMNNKLYNKAENKNCYGLKCGGKMLVKEKMDMLYKDSTIYLDRKYNKYKELCFNCS